MKTNHTIKKVFIYLAVLASIIASIGQGCGSFHSSGSGQSEEAPQPNSVILPSSLEVKAETQTISIAYSRQILDHMVSCLGIGQPTTAIRNEYNARKGTLSEYGHATQVTAPMMMGIAAIAGEVCHRMIEQETAKSANARRILASVDFNAGPSQLRKDIEMQDVVRRIARSCWSRNEEAEELDLIYSSFYESFGTNSDPAQTQTSLLMICTGMLSSLSGVEM